MTYNPDIHHRRTIRLKNYDYSQSGAYFVTICVNAKLCLLGNVRNGEMLLNDAGCMIEKWYRELEHKFSSVQCGPYVVMPNHFHAIIHIVGADLCVRPNNVDTDIPTIVQWFKTMTTNEYIRNVKTHHWKPFSGKLWQRNYYEHIIRNEESFSEIAGYIVNNPMKWADDTLYMAP